MFVKPNSGQRVADPERGGFLPNDGRNVPSTTYWQRRKAAGDVIDVKPLTKPVKSKGADK